MPNTQPTRYHTVEEVAELTGMSVKWLWGQCRDRKIPHNRFGRRYRFSDEDLATLHAQTRVEVLADELKPVGR